MEKLSTEELFGLACSGSIQVLEEYYKEGGDLNVTYSSFGSEHSLIMGAFRNQEYGTARRLKSLGCKLTKEEQHEIDLECIKIQTIQALSNFEVRLK